MDPISLSLVLTAVAIPVVGFLAIMALLARKLCVWFLKEWREGGEC